MENFVFHSPAKMVFGKDQVERLPELLKSHDVKKMLLVYGRKSIKELGIYDKVQDIADELGIELYEESGVRPNPELESVKSGRRTVIQHGIDFILAAGGGSVIDCAKAIAFAAFKKEDAIWDVFLKKSQVHRAIPLGVIVTLAATGSETNGNTVISNDAKRAKRSIKNQALIPQFAIIDPSYTMHVDRYHTVAGSIDIMMHIFEQYFSPTKRTETSDYMSLGILKSVIENTNKLLLEGEDYHTRANISWASTLALNWILQQGKKGDWASHRLVYPPAAKHGLTHGYSLSAMQPTWMRMALERNEEAMRPRLEQLGTEVFSKETSESTIEAIEILFNSWGAPTSIEDLGIEIDDEDAIKFARQATLLGPIGNMFTIDEYMAEAFYKRL